MTEMAGWVSPKYAVAGALANHIQINGDKALACTRVSPATTAYYQDDPMVTDWEVGDIYSFHEAFGFKMNVIRQFWIHQFVEMNVCFW